jgi:hypothetical protein
VTLPLTTTTVTISSPEGSGDPTDAPVVTVVSSAVPAVIGSPSGTEAVAGGQQETVDAVLHVNPEVDLTHLFLVEDESTGELWQVVWVRERTGLGLGHRIAGLRRVKGASSG